MKRKFSREQIQFVLGSDRSQPGTAAAFNLRFDSKIDKWNVRYIKEAYGPRPPIADGAEYTAEQIRFVLAASGNDKEIADKFNTHFGFLFDKKKAINERGVEYLKTKYGPAKPLPP